MKIEFNYTVKLVPEESDTMSPEDVLREIIAYTELTKRLYERKEERFNLYSRKHFESFCENVLSLVKQEVY